VRDLPEALVETHFEQATIRSVASDASSIIDTPGVNGYVEASRGPARGVPVIAVATVRDVRIERGVMGRLPWAAIGSGRPVVVLAGLSMATGVNRDGFVRSVLTPVRRLADRRRLFAVNRRADLAADLTMSAIAN
jgi:hypothetical protein